MRSKKSRGRAVDALAQEAVRCSNPWAPMRRRILPDVELLYDSRCPNAAPTRENLLRAFVQAGLPAKWREWERSAPETPHHARRFGPPAILVNGRDLEDIEGAGAPACRLYRAPADAASGVPSVELIVKALSATEMRRSKKLR
jgi:hypothetical protein